MGWITRREVGPGPEDVSVSSVSPSCLVSREMELGGQEPPEAGMRVEEVRGNHYGMGSRWEA